MSAPIITEGDAFISRFTVAPERRAEFIALFTGLVDGFREQMGQVTHFVFYGWSRADEFIAIESWKDPAIVAAVRQDPNFVTLVSKLLACCSKPMTMDVFAGMNSGRGVFDLYPQGPSQVHPKVGEIGAVFL